MFLLMGLSGGNFFCLTAWFLLFHSSPGLIWYVMALPSGFLQAIAREILYICYFQTKNYTGEPKDPEQTPYDCRTSGSLISNARRSRRLSFSNTDQVKSTRHLFEVLITLIPFPTEKMNTNPVSLLDSPGVNDVSILNPKGKKIQSEMEAPTKIIRSY